jgi:hypothetical protein
MSKKRVLLIANKWWEADPLCWILFHDKARPNVFFDYKINKYPSQRVPSRSTEPRPRDPVAIPRFTFTCLDATVEVWCLEELMNPAVNPSSTAEKARVLPTAIAFGTTPDLVIAFGTAGSRQNLHINGCVVVGRRVYVHDVYEAEVGRKGMWTPPKANMVIESDLPAGAIQGISSESKHSAEARFLQPPVAPANPLLIMAGNGFISLGHVNTVNYDDFSWSPLRSVESFNDNASGLGEIGSVETTHGLIRMISDAPFLYVSGIAATVGLFNTQVTPRVYTQNTVAAHNAAIALAWLLPDVIEALPE